MKPTQHDVDDLNRKANSLRNKIDELEVEADTLEQAADRLQSEVNANDQWAKSVDRVHGYAEWIQEIRGHADIPQFQKNLIEEKLESTTLRGSDLRLAYQSGGMMPPTDLIGLP